MSQGIHFDRYTDL